MSGADRLGQHLECVEPGGQLHWNPRTLARRPDHFGLQAAFAFGDVHLRDQRFGRSFGATGTENGGQRRRPALIGVLREKGVPVSSGALRSGAVGGTVPRLAQPARVSASIGTHPRMRLKTRFNDC